MRRNGCSTACLTASGSGAYSPVVDGSAPTPPACWPPCGTPDRLELVTETRGPHWRRWPPRRRHGLKGLFLSRGTTVTAARQGLADGEGRGGPDRRQIGRASCRGRV